MRCSWWKCWKQIQQIKSLLTFMQKFLCSFDIKNTYTNICICNLDSGRLWVFIFITKYLMKPQKNGNIYIHVGKTTFFAQRIVTNARDILNNEIKITFCSRIYKANKINLGWYQLKDVLYEKEVQGSTIAFKLWRFDKSWRQDVDVKSRSFQTKVNEFYVTSIKV